MPEQRPMSQTKQPITNYPSKEIKMKHDPVVPDTMMLLNEACKELNVRYDFIYGTHYLMWRPLLGLTVIRKHYYADRAKVNEVAEYLRQGYIPAFKVKKSKQNMEFLDSCEKKTLGSIDWIKTMINKDLPKRGKPAHKRKV